MDALLEGGVLPHRLGVAVSGGADSMCLAYLLKEWGERRSIAIIPLVVDHNLRPESAGEARLTQRRLQEWGLAPVMLTWSAPPAYVSQAKARFYRFKMMALACYQLRIRHVCLGHHQDDALETVFMRHQQDSSWRGLAGLSAHFMMRNISFLRPLLTWRKNTLIATLKKEGFSWVEDPSNHHDRFARTHARRWVQDLSPQDYRSWQKVIQETAFKRQAESVYLQSLSPTWDGKPYLHISWNSPIWTLSLDQAGWVLWHWICSLSFQKTPLKIPALQLFWSRLQSIPSHLRCGQTPKIVGTLGGCLFVAQKEGLFIFREWQTLAKKRGEGHLPVGSSSFDGDSFLWDERLYLLRDLPALTPLGVVKGDDSWKDRWARASFPKEAFPMAFPVPFSGGVPGQDVLSECWSSEYLSIYQPCAYPFPFFKAPRER